MEPVTARCACFAKGESSPFSPHFLQFSRVFPYFSRFLPSFPVCAPYAYLKLIVVAQVLTQLLFVERAVMLAQEGCDGLWRSFHRT